MNYKITRCPRMTWSQIPMKRSKGQGKYRKAAFYCYGYGSSIQVCAKASKLGLRQTRVLYRQMNALRGAMSINLNERIQQRTKELLHGH